jgi:hypothetical protein
MEGICYKANNQFFLSSERFTYQTYVINSKLFSLVLDETFSTIDILENNKLVCFPNPVSKILNIDENLKILEILDIYGKKIDVFISDNKIDVSGLNPGLYFLRVEKHGKIKTIKFIKNV